MMASFYYYDQDPSRLLLSCANEGFCYLNLTGATKFKYEKKNEKNSGRSSKMTPSCKSGLLLKSPCPTSIQETLAFILRVSPG